MESNTIAIKNPNGATILEHTYSSNCVRKFSLMNEDSITLRFSSREPLQFPVGTSAGNFYLTSEQPGKWNAATGVWDYDLKFDAYYWLWANRILRYNPSRTESAQETSFSLTATIDMHARIIRNCLKELGITYGKSEFGVNTTDPTLSNEAKLVRYENLSILGGIQAIAEAFDCEWWVIENTIYFGRLENSNSKHVFEAGVNVSSISLSQPKSEVPNRLYVYGSDRNLPTNYRQANDKDTIGGVVVRRLMLPQGTPYLQTRADIPKDEIVEKVVVLDSVYPKTDLTVSEEPEIYSSPKKDEAGNETAQSYYRLKYDPSFLFSKEYVLPEGDLHVIFQSGMLNGMEFGVVFNPKGLNEKNANGSWNPEAQMIEIVANEDYGRLLPDDVLKPKIGDKFILTGWDTTKMENLGLIGKAEQELLQEGKKALEEYAKDLSSCTCPMAWDYMKPLFAENKQPKPGDVVTIIDTAHFGEGGRKSRIIGFEYKLDKPYAECVYTCGENISVKRLDSIEKKLEGLAKSGDKVQMQTSLDFLSKRYNDRTPYRLASDRAFEVGHYLAGVSGGLLGQDPDGKSFAEVDRLWVRVKAFFEELTIVKANVLAGKQYITPGGGIKCTKVEEFEDYFRCYFLSEQDGEKTHTMMIKGDLAICQEFNVSDGTQENVSNHYYWREVVEVNNDAYTDSATGNHYGYIALSKKRCDNVSDTPEVGDEICQFGHKSNSGNNELSTKNKERQTAMVFSTVDPDSPSVKLFSGIDDFSLDNKAVVSFGREADTGQIYFRLGSSKDSQYLKYTQQGGLEIAGKITSASTYDNGSGQSTTLGKALGNTICDTDVLYISHKSATDKPDLPTLGTDGKIEDFKGWSTDAPQWRANAYIWQTTYVRKGDGTASFSAPTCISGRNGVDGAQGPQGVAGQDGENGITYYTWIRYANDANGNGISNSPEGKAYIGFAYNKTVATESNNPSDYMWSEIKGEQGVPGEKGIDGKTYYTWIKYADNANGTGLYDIPNANTKYIGIAVNKETATEGTNPSEYTWSLFRGENGTSITISSQSVKYSTIHTASQPADDTFTLNDVPALSAGQYLWSMTTVSYSNGQSTKSYAVSRIGTNGTNATIKSSTVTYAKSTMNTQPADEQFPATSIGALNIGLGEYLWTKTTVVYSDDTPITSYSVSRIGSDGDTSVAGLHIAYATGITGTLPDPKAVTDFATSMQSGKVYQYMGIYTDDKETDSTDFKDYKWAKFKGDAGDNAKSVTISGEQIFAYADNFTSEATPASITLTATLQNTTGYQWSYKKEGATSFTKISGKTSPTLAVAATDTTYFPTDAKKCVFRCTSGGISDEFTIAKVSSGSNGIDGEDGYTTLLTNESHVFLGDATRAEEAHVNCEIIVYRGNEQIQDVQVVNVTGMPSKGMTVQNYDNKKGFTVSVNNNLTKDQGVLSGVLDVEFTADGKTFNRKFSWVLSLAGRGVSAVVEEYAISAAATKAPADSEFGTSIPTMTDAKPYLWNREKTTYTDNSVVTTTAVVIGVKAQNGVDGATVMSVTNYYLASSKNSGVGKEEEGWTTDPTSEAATVSTAKPYLWNYEVTKWSKGEDSSTLPHIVGAHGSSYTDNLIIHSRIDKENDSYLVGKFRTSEDLKVGVDYTCTIWGELGEGKTQFDLKVNNGARDIVWGIKKVAEGKYVGHGKIAAGTELINAREVLLYQMPQNVASKSKIDHIKLEEGVNVSPQWNANALEGIAPTITEEYYLSSSNYETKDGEWKEASEKDEWKAGWFIWTRSKLTYATGEVEYTTPICVTGSTGAAGESVCLLDMDNEVAGVACDANGSPIGTLPSTNLRVFKGGTLDSGWTFSIASKTGCTAQINGDVLGIISITEKTATVTVQATKDGATTLMATMNVYKVIPGTGFSPNMLLGTVDAVFERSSQNAINTYVQFPIIDNINLKDFPADKQFTVSFEYEYSEVATGAKENYSTCRFGQHNQIVGSPYKALESWIYLPSNSKGLSGSGKCVGVITIPQTMTMNVQKLNFYIQIGSGHVKMWNFKLEEGANPNPQWSPAASEMAGTAYELRTSVDSITRYLDGELSGHCQTSVDEFFRFSQKCVTGGT